MMGSLLAGTVFVLAAIWQTPDGRTEGVLYSEIAPMTEPACKSMAAAWQIDAARRADPDRIGMVFYCVGSGT